MGEGALILVGCEIKVDGFTPALRKRILPGTKWQMYIISGICSFERCWLCRYFLNLVLVDEEDRRYFKQQEAETGARFNHDARAGMAHLAVQFSSSFVVSSKPTGRGGSIRSPQASKV